MNIILNERDWAEEMLQKNDLGKKPTETLSIIAKYYIDKKYDILSTRKMLESFVLKCEPNNTLVNWEERLDYAIKRARKHRLVDIDCIYITHPEMELISSLKGIQLRRLAFTVLCISKFYDKVSDSNNHWVNTEYKDIMSMANINTSLKRQCDMLRQLKELDLIEMSKKVDNNNFRVCFGCEGDTAIRITDFRNLGYQYMRYYGGNYFECTHCGLVEKERNPVDGRKQKYCDGCAVEVKKIQNRESYSRKKNTLLN